MACTQLYHIGILVKDLDQAIADFSDLLGLTFTQPKTATMEGMELYGETTTRSLTLAVSKQGPPHIELIQSHTDGGLWDLEEQGEGVHHIGGWVVDGVANLAERLEAAGHQYDAKVRRPNGDLFVSFLGRKHPQVHNTRFELIAHPGVVGGGLWTPEELAL
jgi:catechol 2,3-dioxygenase-like lactoylglutathione lyase family enzyme